MSKTNTQKSQDKPDANTEGEKGLLSVSKILDNIMPFLGGAGVGALLNHFSNAPSVLYFVAFAISAWMLWRTWRLGGGWRIAVTLICLILFIIVHNAVNYEENRA